MEDTNKCKNARKRKLEHSYCKYPNKTSVPEHHNYAKSSSSKDNLHNSSSDLEHTTRNICSDTGTEDSNLYYSSDTAIGDLKLMLLHGHLQIDGQPFELINVPGDGNCFFHCLSLALHGNNTFVMFFRRLITQHIVYNWDTYKDMAELCHSKQFNSQYHYWEFMTHTNSWATACEIKGACSVFHTNIVTFMQGSRFDYLHQQEETIFTNVSYSFDSQTNKTIFLLLHCNHFKLLRQTHIHHHSPNVMAGENRENTSAPKKKKSHRTATVTTGPYSNATNTTQMEPTDLPNSSPFHITTTTSFTDCVYLPEEEDTFLKCRKLGIDFESSKENETKKEEKLRKNRNYKRIKAGEKKYKVTVDSLPNPPPLSQDKHFNKAMDSIRSFELSQMCLVFNFCSVCKERRLNMNMANEKVCKRCYSDKNTVKMFSFENNMDPGPIPDQLKDLSLTEQQLISRIAPAIHVHMLKHGGIASSGHCVTFPQDVNEPAQILPKLPHEINIIKLRKTGRNNTNKEFRVRRYSVQHALDWLKDNNPAYSDIIICNERLNQLPLDNEVDLLTLDVSDVSTTNDLGPAQEQTDPGEISGDTESGVLLPKPVVSIRDKVEKVVEEVIGPVHGPVTASRGTVTIPWPTRDDIPVSEFTTMHFFSLAFPCLFPNGMGDFFINRPRTCSSLADWADHLIWYDDGRFAQHSYFKFIVHNMIMRKRTLEQSTYIVQQQLGDKQLSVSDIKEKIRNGDNSIAEKIVYFGACLRGTSQYWTQRSKELRSLIQYQINEKKGLPSFFTTGSCAEYHFKSLKRLLEIYTQETSGLNIDLNDKNALFTTLQKNTHIVGHYFDIRTKSYFEHVMGPVFGVDSYWYRQEFAKSRGMIHWHGLCWRADREPHVLLHDAISNGLSDEDSAKLLANWAKSEFKLTALHPAGKNDDGLPHTEFWPPPEGTAPLPPEESNPLLKLFMDVSETQESIVQDHLLLSNRINLHRCSDYCLRKPHASSSNKTTKVCRMEFGSEEVPGKTLRDKPAIVKDKNGSMRLELERDHPILVQHSQYHTQGWRANGDISLILSKAGADNPSVDEIIATERYVSGYACKGSESTGALVHLFNDLANVSDDASGATAKSLCTKLLMHTIKRDVSAVEASFELSCIPLFRCSHQFQSVSMSGSRVLEKTGATLTKSTPLDKYLARPRGDQTSWYEFVCNSGKVPVVSGAPVRATWPLSEDFCRTMMLLHSKNWREIKDIKSENTTWFDTFLVFLQTDQCPLFVKADVERAKRYMVDPAEDDSDSSNEESDVQQPEWMDLIAPNAVFDDFTSDFKYDDGGEGYDWTASTYDYPQDLGTKFVENLSSEQLLEDSELDLAPVNLNTLNVEQKFAYTCIMNTLFDYVDNPENFKALRMVIAGTAGTGKSYLIKCLVNSIRQLFNSNRSVQVLCPTGNSANLISGVTLHSFLKLPTSSKSKGEMIPPDGSLGENLQKSCQGLHALLIDERSMIGCTTLGWMEYQCHYAVKEKSELSWGGIPVVVFLGDDVQLPPVCDSPVYNCQLQNPAAMHGVLVWKEFTTAVTLTDIVRQDESQTQLRTALMAMREYKTTKEQAVWLQRFQWANLRLSYGKDFLSRIYSEGLFVFPNHSDEWNHNKKKLIDLNTTQPIAKICSISRGAHAKSSSSDKASGLVRTLYLCKGAKVMLTTNLNVKFGLFNGSIGTVIDIIYGNGNSPKDSLPTVCMVEFPKYTGPSFLSCKPKLVPIVPVQRRLECSCFHCHRQQIPLRLGWGTTIHRCQGMTIGEGESSRFIVINPGTRHFESKTPGALYVALSRAKSAGGLNILPDFAWHPDILVNEDRLCHVVNTSTTRSRKKEMDRIEKLTLQTKQDLHHCRGDEAFQAAVSRLEHLVARHED